ncbi:amidohydrolase family protein [Streptomyces sp. NPDC002643]
MRIIGLEEHYLSRPWDGEGPGAGIAGLDAVLAGMEKRLLETGEQRIADMDAAGIDVQVLSLAGPGGETYPPADAVTLAREENDRLAEIVKRHPDRLKAFAALPTTAQPEAAADELERAVREYGFKGALVNGSTDGRFLDDERFRPVLERAEALDVPLYLHPGVPPAGVMRAYYDGFSPQVNFTLGTAAWGWHIDTGLHVLRMILAGAFDRFPRLQIVIGHLGEALPFMLPRANRTLPPVMTGLSRTITEYVRENVHFTIAGFFYVPTFLNTLLEVGADRILFSVDYPIGSNDEGRAFLDRLPVSPADREKIAYRNAETLLRI